MTMGSSASPGSAQPPVAAAGAGGSGTAGAAGSSSMSGAAALVVLITIGVGVSVALGVYGRVHEPTRVAVNLAGFSGPLAAKSWLATGAVLFALVQLVSALAMYNRLPGLGVAPSWTPTLHRWSGRIAFLLAVPVAVHCLYALGLQYDTTRVLVHSILGCFFFGVFTMKMLVLSRPGMPNWTLPVFGGLVFTALAGIWLTSSLWFFTTVGVTF